MVKKRKPKKNKDLRSQLFARQGTAEVVLRVPASAPEGRDFKKVLAELGFEIENRGTCGIYDNWIAIGTREQLAALPPNLRRFVEEQFLVKYGGPAVEIEDGRVKITDLDPVQQVILKVATKGMSSAERSFKSVVPVLRARLTRMIDDLLNGEAELPLDAAQELYCDVAAALSAAGSAEALLKYGHADAAAWHACEAGRLVERCEIRFRHERAARTGHRKKERNARIAKDRTVLDDEHIRRHAAVQNVMNQGTKGKMQAYKAAAAAYRTPGGGELEWRSMQESYLKVERDRNHF